MSASRRTVLLAAAALLSGACKEVPKGGVVKSPAGVGTGKKPRGGAVSRRLSPDEVIPADLDTVVRVDIDRLRKALGADFEQQLARRFLDDPIAARAVAKSRALTVAVRAAELEAGDRVLVVEGDPDLLHLERDGFTPRPSANDKVRVLLRDVPVSRYETQLAVVLDERAVALVTPIEVDAVLRVLRDGSDALRGQPIAEGIVSADVRPRRMPPSLERKYPSLARLVSQVQRIRLSLNVSDDSLLLAGEIIARSDASADKVRRFVDAFREGATGEGPVSAVLRNVKLEKLGAVVRVTTRMPIADIAVLLGGASPPPAPPADAPTPPR